ncbi:hypothetical protein [Streptomyces sp. NPDC088923]|uniref:hypothetical protein n=1 Tax=Streptomyces sp. NPDC088923 TaxID=3365913 RepID=UPI0038016E42
MSVCALCEHHETPDVLCLGCTAATADRLDRMPRLYEALAGWLPPGSASSAPTGPRVEAPLPVSLPVLSMRGPGGIVGVLEDWRSAMQAARAWGEPHVTGDTAQRVRAAARGLAVNLDWMAAEWQPVAVLAAELRDLERQVRELVDPAPAEERGMRLGACPADVGEGQVCGAVLRYRRGEQAVTCRWCGSTYPRGMWAVLGALVVADEGAQTVPLTSADVAYRAALGVPRDGRLPSALGNA